jgi:hypothetical protein
MVKAAFPQLTVQKPQPEQIVTKLLAQKPLTAHAKERHQNPRLKQLLGRNAGPAFSGIELVKQGRELLQDGVGAAFDSSQRMIGRDRRIEINHGQEVRLGLRFSAHADPIQSTGHSFKQQNVTILGSTLRAEGRSVPDRISEKNTESLGNSRSGTRK